jgi:hypothetical protein
MKTTQTPVIQRLGNTSRDGSVVHIGGTCYERRETLEPISRETFNRIVLHRHRELQTWDPMND